MVTSQVSIDVNNIACHVNYIPTMHHFMLTEKNRPMRASEFDWVWPGIPKIVHYGNVVNMPYFLNKLHPKWYTHSMEFSAPNPMQLVRFFLGWFANHFKSLSNTWIDLNCDFWWFELIWIDQFWHYGLRWIDLIWSQMTVIWIDLNCKNGELSHLCM